MKKKLTALLLSAMLILSLAACGGGGTAATDAPTDEPSATPQTTEAPAPEATEEPAQDGEITQDRQGNPIVLPESMDKIMTFGASNAEVLVGLGVGDRIIAVDTYTYGVEGLSAELPQFELSSPDSEQIIAMEPDAIFVTGMVQSQGDDPYKLISDAGICVIYMPSSSSIDEIKEDIRYIAEVMDVQENGETLISELEAAIDEVRAIGETITEKKTVYFEIAAAPAMYSFGSGTFLNEMIELIGAENVFADQQSWISVGDEAILTLNPDVILTSVDYIENPTDEVMSRPGWDAMTAVQNGDVYYIDTNSCNRPSQNIVKALHEMALAVYPDQYSSLSSES